MFGARQDEYRAEFQTLIGSLQTKSVRNNYRSVRKFQSLIGSIQTHEIGHSQKNHWAFQTLIGGLQTKHKGDLSFGFKPL